MNHLRAIWLLITSQAFFLQTNRGFESTIPLDHEILQDIIEANNEFNGWLFEQVDYIEQDREEL